MRVDAVTGESRALSSTRRKLRRVASVGHRETEAATRMANSPALQFNPDETAILITTQTTCGFTISPAGAAKRLTNNRDEEKEADFSPDGRWVSFVRGNNLFVVDVAKGAKSS